ncbi:MAG: TSUP family transporter [Spartobacteria bacterium]
MILTALFCLVALVYSSVGFGGGSSYIALLQWSGMASSALPILSLACNLIVSSQGFAQFARAGYFSVSRSLPFVLLSVPAAYFGGLYVINESTFLLLLAGSLTVAGLLLLFPVEESATREDNRIRQGIRRFGFLLGLPLGFLSGVVGIGGGIFLAPILHLAKWARAKEIAALAACFICTNSLAGLIGQLQKFGWNGEVLANHWMLPVAVLLGGLVGSRCGASILPPVRIRQITGAIILFVASNLWLKQLPTAKAAPGSAAVPAPQGVWASLPHRDQPLPQSR